jgi:hypothetical protein
MKENMKEKAICLVSEDKELTIIKKYLIKRRLENYG